jgi:prepilin peptidase CpaA
MDPIYQYFLYGVAACYTLLLVVSAITDVTRFIIPNLVVLALIVLFVVTAAVLPIETDWLSHIGAAAVVFAGGIVLYAIKAFGAGDIKLLAALALWVGFDHLIGFLVYVSLLGGALALGLLVLRRVIFSLQVSMANSENVTMPRLLLQGEPVPYGLAIAPAGIAIAYYLPHLGELLFL